MSDKALSARLNVWAHEGPMFDRAHVGRRILPFLTVAADDEGRAPLAA